METVDDHFLYTVFSCYKGGRILTSEMTSLEFNHQKGDLPSNTVSITGID